MSSGHHRDMRMTLEKTLKLGQEMWFISEKMNEAFNHHANMKQKICILCVHVHMIFYIPLLKFLESCVRIIDVSVNWHATVVTKCVSVGRKVFKLNTDQSECVFDSA